MKSETAVCTEDTTAKKTEETMAGLTAGGTAETAAEESKSMASAKPKKRSSAKKSAKDVVKDVVKDAVKDAVEKRKIMWRNRYSGETGFVKAIRESKGYFENGSVEDAHVFGSDAECRAAIDVLNAIGEGRNNDFMTTLENGNCVSAAEA